MVFKQNILKLVGHLQDFLHRNEFSVFVLSTCMVAAVRVVYLYWTVFSICLSVNIISD
jgi:hypothetical protein